MNKKLLSMLIALGLCAGSVNASLVHRYDFSVDASDSVGTAHGTVVTGIIEDGQLKTDGSMSGYNAAGVRLPLEAVAGLTGAFTLQSWFFAPAPQGDWHTLFTFDDQTPAQENFVIATPIRGDGGWNSSVHARQQGVVDYVMRGSSMDVWGDNPDQSPRLMTVTYDGAKFTYYENGVPGSISSSIEAIGFDLEAITTNIGLNGGAPYNDPSLNGSTYDFRIYDEALGAEEIGDVYAIGADASNEAIAAAIVPEPATMALLGLGALGLARRKK